MKQKILTAGCSFTKDNYQKTWADYLAGATGYELNNIGARGAGIDFITSRLFYECTASRYDLVVIMLPSVDRMDLYVNHAHPLKDEFKSISSWQNGKNPGFVTVDGTLSDNYGYALSGGQIRGLKKYWYKYYYNETSSLLAFWTKVYSIENFLKIQNIKYKFTMAYDKDHIVEQSVNMTGDDCAYQFLWENIDWNNFIFYKNNRGFLSFVKDHQYKIINNHPDTHAHESWVNNLIIPNLK